MHRLSGHDSLAVYRAKPFDTGDSEPSMTELCRISSSDSTGFGTAWHGIDTSESPIILDGRPRFLSELSEGLEELWCRLLYK
jgi:hypothetical protein